MGIIAFNLITKKSKCSTLFKVAILFGTILLLYPVARVVNFIYNAFRFSQVNPSSLDAHNSFYTAQVCCLRWRRKRRVRYKFLTTLDKLQKWTVRRCLSIPGRLFLLIQWCDGVCKRTEYVTFGALEEALVKDTSESASEASATRQAVRSGAAFILTGCLPPLVFFGQ